VIHARSYTGTDEQSIFDPAKAKALLQQSGISDTEFDIVYSNTNFGDGNAALAQIIQAELLSLDVKPNPRQLDSATYLDQTSKHAFRGGSLSVGSEANVAEVTSFLTRSRYFSPDPRSSFSGLDSPTYRQLVGQAAIEPDATKRKALYSQIDDVIQDAAFVSLYLTTSLARASVQGLAYDARPQLTYAPAWSV
jgi:ABC-type transport system substrate-binding protein